jgi:protein SCO1/2
MVSVSIASALRRTLPRPPPVLGALADFALEDQSGRTFRSEELRGKPWVADVIFTRCGTVCPRLTGRMGEVQHRARNLGAAFHMVSFTVDPEHDTPEVLAAYAARYHASPRLWSFLTGTRESIRKVVVEGLKLGMGNDEKVEGGPAGEGGLYHDSHFVLVDPRMRVRGYYAVGEDGETDRLMRDLGLILAEQARGR